MADTDTFYKQSAELRFSSLTTPAIEVLQRCSVALGYEGRETIDKQFSVLSGVPEEDNLEDHISALLDFIERCPVVTQQSGLAPIPEICCGFQSPGGGLGGVSLSTALLTRLGSAGSMSVLV